jgi:hypothetical protein
VVRTLAAAAGPVGAGHRILHYSTPLWDGALFGILLGLGHGARLEIVTGPPLAGDDLAELVCRRRVTHAGLTPPCSAACRWRTCRTWK